GSPAPPRVVTMVTPVAKVPSALRNSRASKGAAVCAWACAGPGMAGSRGCDIGRSEIGRVGRQAQGDAAIGDAVRIPVDGVMPVRRMDVAPGALQRIAFIDGAAARRGEDDVDGL